MARFRTALAIVLGASTPIAACSLTTDFDDLTGGIPDAAVRTVYIEAGPGMIPPSIGPSDATLPPNDAPNDASNDAPTDATADDTSTHLDADTDSASDAAPIDAGYDGPFCLGQGSHTLCSDFDEGVLVFDYSDSGLQWVQNVFGGAGSLALDDGDASSPPASMHAAVTATDAATGATAAGLQIGLPGSPTLIHAEFDIRPGYSTSIAYGSVYIFSIFEVVGASYFGISVGMDNSTPYVYASARMADGGIADFSHALPALAANKWTHVTIIDTRAVAGNLYIALDGEPALNQAIDTMSLGGPTITLDLGLTVIGLSPSLDVHYDNVVIDVAH